MVWNRLDTRISLYLGRRTLDISAYNIDENSDAIPAWWFIWNESYKCGQSRSKAPISSQWHIRRTPNHNSSYNTPVNVSMAIKIWLIYTFIVTRNASLQGRTYNNSKAIVNTQNRTFYFGMQRSGCSIGLNHGSKKMDHSPAVSVAGMPGHVRWWHESCQSPDCYVSWLRWD